MTDMDRFCTLIVVVGAVVLVVMGYGEIARLRMQTRNLGGGTCGMQARASNESNVPAKSAKRATRAPKVPTEEDASDGEYLSLNDEWPNQTEEEPKHKELSQDDKVLSEEFTWEASADDDEKFESMKIDPEKVKASANIKAINPEIVREQPTHSRTVGMKNPMLAIYHNGGKDEEVKFGKSCAWFGGTAAYFEARERSNQACCVGDKCE